MEATDFNKSIKNCIEFALETNFLIQAGSYCSLSASYNFKRLSREAVEYIELYEVGIQNQDFNLVIKDNSFFQFSIHGSDIRLAYYPNPFLALSKNKTYREAKDMLDNGELDLMDYEQILSEEVCISDTPVIRFDYSVTQYDEDFHPCAHFHIGFNGENRWASKIVLSPFAFFLKIIRLYYLEHWKENYQSLSSRSNLDEMFARELNMCCELSQELFSVNEERRTYIT